MNTQHSALHWHRSSRKLEEDPFIVFVSNRELLTNDVRVDLHLPVLLCQLESFVVALGQNQEVDG